MNWIVPVSEQERATGLLSPATMEAALGALKTRGCVLLRGVLDVARIDQLNAALEAQLAGLDETALARQAKVPGPNPVLEGGSKRYEVLVKLRSVFAQPSLLANSLLCGLLTQVLDQGMRLSGVTAVISFPGAEMQHVHTDSPLLFLEPGVSASLPAHAINVAVPLVDVDAHTGPTGIWLGSHLWPPDRDPKLEELTISEFLRGDCILIDYRTKHAGMPNRGRKARPILYMVYARHWFFDDLNHLSRPSLDMPPAEFAALPDEVKPLLARAYSLHARARYLADSQT